MTATTRTLQTRRRMQSVTDNHSNRGVDAFVVSFAQKIPAFFVGARSPRRTRFFRGLREKDALFLNERRRPNNKEQGRGKEAEEQQQQQEDDDDDDEEQETIQTTTMLVVGVLVYDTRDKEEEEEKEEKEYNSNNFYKVVVEEQYHLRHLRDGNQEYEKI